MSSDDHELERNKQLWKIKAELLESEKQKLTAQEVADRESLAAQYRQEEAEITQQTESELAQKKTEQMAKLKPHQDIKAAYDAAGQAQIDKLEQRDRVEVAKARTQENLSPMTETVGNLYRHPDTIKVDQMIDKPVVGPDPALTTYHADVAAFVDAKFQRRDLVTESRDTQRIRPLSEILAELDAKQVEIESLDDKLATQREQLSLDKPKASGTIDLKSLQKPPDTPENEQQNKPKPKVT